MASSGSSSRGGGASSDFQSFFENWLVHQEHFHDELQSVLENCEESRMDDLSDLVGRVFSHYQEYYEEKSRMSHSNIFLAFDPPWFTPFEKSLFWVAGFKPDLVFKVVAVAVEDLNLEQSQLIEEMKKEIRVFQRELGNELARIQETVAGPEISAFAMNANFPVNVGEMEGGLENLKAELVTLLSNCDTLRTSTAERVAEILNPVQNVKFLAAATRLQLSTRKFGLEKVARNRG